MDNHKTKLIKYKDMEAEVDENIADLILNLWKLNIMTVLSCENNVPDDFVWIEFMSVTDAEEFLNIAAGSYSDDVHSMYNRIRQAWSENDDDDDDFWLYNVNIDDMNVSADIIDDCVEEKSSGKPEFNVFMSVRFPLTDLEEVKKKVANKLICFN